MTNVYVFLLFSRQNTLIDLPLVELCIGSIINYKGHFEFQLLGECHCWLTMESPRAHVAKFFGRLRLIGSVLRASNFPCLKLIEIVILWVNYTIPFGVTLFWHFFAPLLIF